MEIPWKTVLSEKRLFKPPWLTGKVIRKKTIYDQTTKTLVVVDFLGNASIPPSFSSSCLFFFFLRGADVVNAVGWEGTGARSHWWRGQPFPLLSRAQMRSGEMAANIARELAEHTRSHLYAGDIAYSVSAMVQLVNLLDVQLRNLTPGGKDSAARSLNKVRATRPFDPQPLT